MDMTKLITVVHTYAESVPSYNAPLEHKRMLAVEANGGKQVVIFDASAGNHREDGTYTHTSRWLPA